MTWQEDAKLAGTLYRKSKVYQSLLIARCVEPDHGNGNRPEMDTSKTSLRSFASHAEISTTTASKYLCTWDTMAQAGIVPRRDELQPGVDVDLPDHKTWVTHYRDANRSDAHPTEIVPVSTTTAIAKPQPEPEPEPIEAEIVEEQEPMPAADQLEEINNLLADYSPDKLDELAKAVATAYDSEIWRELDYTSWAKMTAVELVNERPTLTGGELVQFVETVRDVAHVPNRALSHVIGVDEKTIRSHIPSVSQSENEEGESCGFGEVAESKLMRYKHEVKDIVKELKGRKLDELRIALYIETIEKFMDILSDALNYLRSQQEKRK